MFERQPSNVQVLLALVEEDTAAVARGEETAEELKAKLKRLGVEIQEGLSPQEMYAAAVHCFKNAQSFYHTQTKLAVAKKTG
jgi:hypothetical protein